jgi:hypothetical protein
MRVLDVPPWAGRASGHGDTEQPEAAAMGIDGGS